MQTCINLADLSQDCLAKLNQALDLVLKTAEAASADNNHKVVLQAAREVTRIVSLISKMIDPKTKPKSTLVPCTNVTGQDSRVSPAARKTEALPALGIKKTPSRSQSAATNPPTAVQPQQTGIGPENLILPDLDTFFPPREVASWDGDTQALFQNISRSYQELQAIGAEMAAALEAPDRGNGKYT
jgi:hypothetical protein